MESRVQFAVLENSKSSLYSYVNKYYQQRFIQLNLVFLIQFVYTESKFQNKLDITLLFSDEMSPQYIYTIKTQLKCAYIYIYMFICTEFIEETGSTRG